MTFENKHLMNSSSRGKFSRMRVSEARDLIQRLVEATREYDDPQWRRRCRTSEATALEGKLESRMGGIEKLLAKVVDRVERSLVAEAMCTSCGKDDHVTTYCKADEREETTQANAAISGGQIPTNFSRLHLNQPIHRHTKAEPRRATVQSVPTSEGAATWFPTTKSRRNTAAWEQSGQPSNLCTKTTTNARGNDGGPDQLSTVHAEQYAGQQRRGPHNVGCTKRAENEHRLANEVDDPVGHVDQ